MQASLSPPPWPWLEPSTTAAEVFLCGDRNTGSIAQKQPYTAEWATTGRERAVCGTWKGGQGWLLAVAYSILQQPRPSQPKRMPVPYPSQQEQQG